MYKSKKRNISICGTLLLIMIGMALFTTLNDTGNVHASSPVSLDSIIYTDPSAFQFTPISSTECSVKLVDKTQVNVRVPKTATINGIEYTVTEVATNGFSSTSGLKTVILPKTVEKIGNGAFQNCKDLELVYAPSMREIGSTAFAFCTSLSDIIFPATLETVGTGVFMMTSTKVHARFNTVQSGWASNWNTGNTIQNHDFNVRDIDGNLWTHDFIYEEISQTNPITRTTSISRRLAPLQPTSEANVNHGHRIIESGELELIAGTLSDGLYQSITIEPASSPINIWSYAFNNITVIEGIYIDREVTYNCPMFTTSTYVFNTVNTPSITLPVPQKIFNGMFFSNQVKNINFRTATGITYEDEGVVKIPSEIQVIEESAFQNIVGITEMHITENTTTIESNAFADWNNTQTIYMPFIGESHATSVLGNGWLAYNSAIIEYEAEFLLVSQPTNITDNSAHNVVFELSSKMQSHMNKYSLTATGTAYNNTTGLSTSIVNKGVSQRGDLWVQRWEIAVKHIGTGGARLVLTGKLLDASSSTICSIPMQEIKIHRLLRSAADFNAFTPSSSDIYDTYLVNDINLGTYSGYIKNINYKGFYGNNHTLTYTINVSTVTSATASQNLGLFNQNQGTIGNLYVNANINVSGTNLTGTAGIRVGGIAVINATGAQIKRVDCTVNFNINHAYSEIGGITATNDGTIDDTYTFGSITTPEVKRTPIGGIASWNGEQGKITNSRNNATLNGYANMGGIAAQSDGAIENSSNYGSITNNFTYSNGSQSSVGGIVGLFGMNSGGSRTIKNSTNIGTITFGTRGNTTYLCQPNMGLIVGLKYGGTLSSNTAGGYVNTNNLLNTNEKLYAQNAAVGRTIG